MVPTLLLIPLSLFLIIVPTIAQIIMSIIGTVRASKGEIYSYPFQIRILN